MKYNNMKSNIKKILITQKNYIILIIVLVNIISIYKIPLIIMYLKMIQ